LVDQPLSQVLPLNQQVAKIVRVGPGYFSPERRQVVGQEIP
jgi:hypothetical protein